MVKDMFAARGIIVSHQTISLWAEKFGRHFAKDIRKRSAGRLADKWHLDEVVLTIRDKKHWLWRAVDQNGFVLDVLVQSRRNAKAFDAQATERTVPVTACVGPRTDFVEVCFGVRRPNT